METDRTKTNQKFKNHNWETRTEEAVIRDDERQFRSQEEKVFDWNRGKLCKKRNKGVKRESDVLISSMSFVAIFKPEW